MEGYVELVKIAEAALNGDIEKSKFQISKFIEKYPDSELIKPFKALLIGDNNPDRLVMCVGKESSDENSNCDKPLVSGSFCPECNSENIRPYNDTPMECLECHHVWL